jgi:anaerobic selenocysteine-containing dehydrogenase
MGSVHKAWIWGIFFLLPKSFAAKAERVGYKPGPLMFDEIYQDLIDNPGGVWVGEEDPADQMEKIQHPDKKIHLFEIELDEWITEITPESEDAALSGTPEFPLTLQAGRHIEAGMNGLMRNPYTHTARNPCTLAIHPDDAKTLNVSDGQLVRVTTDVGSVEIEAEYTYETRKGFLMIPHHFGFTFEGKTYGVGVNRLTNKLMRDRIAGTPFHHNVKCRVEPVEGGDAS